MSLILKRDPDSRHEDYYLVYNDDVVVGRIFNRLAGTGVTEHLTWFWGLDYLIFLDRGCKPPHYGNAETHDKAMAKFKMTWESGGPE